MFSRQNFGDSTGALRGQASVSKLCEADRIEVDETANAIIYVDERIPSTVNPGQKFLALPDEVL